MEETRPYDYLYNKYASFRSCANAIYIARQRELRKVGASTATAAIMFAISYYGGTATPGEIARRLVLEPHSIVGTITRMERDGLVNRVRGNNPRDRRITQVTLTERGKAIWSQVKRSQGLITRLFSALSNEELELMERWLEIMKTTALARGQDEPA